MTKRWKERRRFCYSAGIEQIRPQSKLCAKLHLFFEERNTEEREREEEKFEYDDRCINHSSLFANVNWIFFPPRIELFDIALYLSTRSLSHAFFLNTKMINQNNTERNMFMQAHKEPAVTNLRNQHKAEKNVLRINLFYVF